MIETTAKSMKKISDAWRRGWNGAPPPSPPARPRSELIPVSRFFEAADTGRLFSGWTTQPHDIDTLLAAELLTLRARCRDQIANNPYAARYVKLIVDNVVGPEGFGFQSKVTRGGNPDKEVSQAIERHWKRFCRTCDVTGRQDFRQLCGQALGSAAYDGEFALRFVRSPGLNEYGFGLQLIDADRIDLRYKDRHENNEIFMGVELNDWDRPVAYHVKSRRRYGSVAPSADPFERVRIPSSDMILGFLPHFVGQSRGLPWMTPSLWDLRQINGGKQAAIVNMRVGAAKMGFIETEPGAEGYEGDKKPDAQGSTVMDADPGVISRLAPGSKFTSWDPSYPNGEYPPFLEACLRGIASGLNMAYESLASDRKNVNFSSIRAGVLEDRETFKGLQSWLIFTMIRPVFENWLESALLAGAITLDNGARLRDLRIDTFKEADFQGRRWEYVDPLKDINARGKELALGLTSRGALIRERAKDPEEVWTELADEDEKIADIGLAFNQRGERIATRTSRVNRRASAFAKASILQGNYDAETVWTFSPADALPLADSPRRYYLLEDQEIGEGAGYRFPTGKYIGETFVVFLSALELVAALEPMEGPEGVIIDEVQNAADGLIALIEAGLLVGIEGDDLLGDAVDDQGNPKDEIKKPPEEEPEESLPPGPGGLLPG